jgi:outer membrane receptor protein involved in Fe transport
VEDLWKINERLSIIAGLRLSHFSVNQKNYLNLEPRFSAAYKLPNDAAIKVSFARMNQYIHLLSNSGLGLPTDLWVSATDRVPPQTSQQVALGYVKDFSEKNFSLSIEGYYKKMDNIIGYKQGASFLLLDVGPDPQKINSIDWQENVTSGQGKAYGLELMLQRKTGDSQVGLPILCQK